MAKLLDNIVSELSRLPGIGRRTALRLAMHILKMDESDVETMSASIADFRHHICHCPQCGNLSDEGLCDVCRNPMRDSSTICVVEQVGDLLSIEKTQQYRGTYLVLGGVISPMQGIGPSDLNVDLLVERIRSGKVEEVIIAISTSVEGETTLFYLMNQLRKFPALRITNIARGIGFGDELEYVDEQTITHAMANRRPIE